MEFLVAISWHSIDLLSLSNANYSSNPINPDLCENLLGIVHILRNQGGGSLKMIMLDYGGGGHQLDDVL